MANLSIASIVVFQALAILVLSLLAARYRRSGRRNHLIIRKWYHRESSSLAHEADSLRDGSLQELFALRRSLELAAIHHPDHSPTQLHTWIQQIESLQTSLGDLMDRLVPPFVEESLPLTIATRLRQVKQRDQEFEFSIDYPETWDLNDPLPVNKAILAFFQGLESDISSKDGIASIALAFRQDKGCKQTSINLRCDQNSASFYSKIDDLCRTVVFLSEIDYRLSLTGNNLSVTFRWLTVEPIAN